MRIPSFADAALNRRTRSSLPMRLADLYQNVAFFLDALFVPTRPAFGIIAYLMYAKRLAASLLILVYNRSKAERGVSERVSPVQRVFLGGVEADRSLPCAREEALMALLRKLVQTVELVLHVLKYI